jgi:hypothetical protein
MITLKITNKIIIINISIKIIIIITIITIITTIITIITIIIYK